MATIDKNLGQIRDRTIGYKPISYYVDNKSKKYMDSCLKAHEAIMGVLTPKARENITPKEVKAAVLAYVAIDSSHQKEFLKKMALSGYGEKNEKPEVSLERLAETWFEQKTVQGVTDKQRDMMLGQKTMILDFFNSQGFKTVADLKPDTVHKFLTWCSVTNYTSSKKAKISASTLKHNLQVLKQMARIAVRNDWIVRGDIWDDVHVKSIVGVNRKIIEPLSVDLQKEILATLQNPRHHDGILLLLITGMRVGELDTLKPDSIKNNAIILHGQGVGAYKPESGKSTTANLYGKFVPEHFKAGFEEAIKERKELVEWLESGYFAE